MNNFLSHTQDNFWRDGFVIRPLGNSDDLRLLIDVVSESFTSTVSAFSPSISRIFEHSGIQNYHTNCHLVDHKTLWTKFSRILRQNHVRAFKQLDTYKSLVELFGPLDISDEEHLGFPNIYWRLVRPNQPSDVGPIHRDAWFWELNNNFGYAMQEKIRFKIWIPLIVEPGLNGLLVCPGSHQNLTESYSVEFSDGINKPRLKQKTLQIKPVLANVHPGEMLIFDDNLLHGGALNMGSSTRVSIEFTILSARK